MNPPPPPPHVTRSAQMTLDFVQAMKGQDQVIRYQRAFLAQMLRGPALPAPANASNAKRGDDDANNRAKVPSHFVVVNTLGVGLSGATFTCLRVEDLNKTQDVSVLQTQLVVVKVSNGEIFDNGDSADKMMANEISAIRHMPYSRHFVRFLETSLNGATNQYIVMEAIQGLTLSDCYATKYTPSIALVWHIFVELIDILLELHHGGLNLRASCHGDIRGPNVMLDYNRRHENGLPGVVLIDFGYAIIRPRDVEDIPDRPERDVFLRDHKGLVTQVHAMAHNQDPAIQWESACTCVKDGTATGMFLEDPEMFTIVYKQLITKLEKAKGHVREKKLEEYKSMAKKWLHDSLGLEDAVKDAALVDDLDITNILHFRNNAGPVIPPDEREYPPSGPQHDDAPPENLQGPSGTGATAQTGATTTDAATQNALSTARRDLATAQNLAVQRTNERDAAQATAAALQTQVTNQQAALVQAGQQITTLQGHLVQAGLWAANMNNIATQIAAQALPVAPPPAPAAAPIAPPPAVAAQVVPPLPQGVQVRRGLKRDRETMTGNTLQGPANQRRGRFRGTYTGQ